MIDLPRGRLLGIDHGAKVIGLAVCDAMWIVARPLGLLHRETRASDFEAIQTILDEQNITAIVLGLPETPEDFSGISQADTVRRWATRLAAAVKIPVYLWDEGFSSFEADQLALELGDSLTTRNDDRAAAVILQSFIDAHPAGSELPPMLKAR